MRARAPHKVSTRGLRFLDRWVAAEQLPIVARGDPIAASELADQLMTAAEKAGIPADEINGEVESVFESLLEVTRRRTGEML
ncbi:DUF768 domain-containing protein [Mesorhizobium sp. LSJC264A00]|uniref:DUF768 domain-containing protein n=1 Tax=unclassified Mesorhizobium TaxID=325217 RepID=UPI000A075A45|nr:DUF768 domain-containing protein [Mesorhizobium sp. LSJC264A00]